MNTEKLIQQLKDCEKKLFILELDDFAYCHGKGGEISDLYNKIKALKVQLSQV